MSEPEKRPGPGAGPVVAVLFALAAFGGIVAFRSTRPDEAGGGTAAAQALPRVRVARVKRAPADVTLTLPGSARADQDTGLYARINGYLKSWSADLGDSVKKGQVLAEIDSPEIDQQLRQARATLGVAQAALLQAQAQQELARVASERWETLVKEKAVSQQEADEKRLTLKAREADLESARASIRAQEAAVKRLEELSSFKQLQAPFDGVISARNVEVGMLVTEGSSSSARELYRLTQGSSLRLFVPVPEVAVPSLKPGLAASVAFDAYPRRKFEGVVSRISGSIDPASRTMAAELRLANAEGLLLPGMYGQVTFKLHREVPPLLVTSNAMLVRTEGVLVARIGSDDVVRYVKVQLGRDYGAEVEVISGLEENDRVMANPSTGIAEGQKVDPQAGTP
jgi:RND family efflux transporter MFP subunit